MNARQSISRSVYGGQWTMTGASNGDAELLHETTLEVAQIMRTHVNQASKELLHGIWAASALDKFMLELRAKPTNIRELKQLDQVERKFILRRKQYTIDLWLFFALRQWAVWEVLLLAKVSKRIRQDFAANKDFYVTFRTRWHTRAWWWFGIKLLTYARRTWKSRAYAPFVPLLAKQLATFIAKVYTQFNLYTFMEGHGFMHHTPGLIRCALDIGRAWSYPWTGFDRSSRTTMYMGHITPSIGLTCIPTWRGWFLADRRRVYLGIPAEYPTLPCKFCVLGAEPLGYDA